MTKPVNDLSYAEVVELIHYDPETGDLKWLKDRGTAKAGDLAGCVSKSRYRLLRINKRLYKAHRICWLLYYGVWPENFIDHRDGNKLNNRISNLREATAIENLRNKTLTKQNSSGFKGVSWSNAAGKWVAQITANGRNHYLGLFINKEDASEAYARAANDLHQEFARIA